MKFEGIKNNSENNHSVKGTKKSFHFGFFGIKKGKYLMPLSKDTIDLSLKRTTDEELTKILDDIAEKSFGNPQLFTQYLRRIIEEGTQKNPQLRENRICTIKTSSENNMRLINKIVVLSLDKKGQESFILDNLTEIESIFKRKHVPENSELQILRALDETNYKMFVEHSNLESLVGTNFTSEILELCSDSNTF